MLQLQQPVVMISNQNDEGSIPLIVTWDFQHCKTLKHEVFRSLMVSWSCFQVDYIDTKLSFFTQCGLGVELMPIASFVIRRDHLLSPCIGAQAWYKICTKDLAKKNTGTDLVGIMGKTLLSYSEKKLFFYRRALLFSSRKSPSSAELCYPTASFYIFTRKWDFLSFHRHWVNSGGEKEADGAIYTAISIFLSSY